MGMAEQAARRLEELKRADAAVATDAARGTDAQAPLRPAIDGHANGEPSVLRIRPTRSVHINLKRLQAAGYLVPDLAQSQLADEYRYIKRTLLSVPTQADDPMAGRGSLIMVTSALLGEGKTFCAINLAMSIAMEVDRSVLLVDADVMRPSVMDRIGLRNARGLLDVLADPQLDLGEVLLRTNVPKLSLLPTGTLHNRASEMLASTAMDKLLIELASRYSDRIVIFDSPPLLMSPGTASLATRMGQTVVVVEASKTPRRTVEQAFDAVADCPKVTALLNKCSSPMDGHVYGYYGQPVAPITPVGGVGPWLRSLFERRA